MLEIASALKGGKMRKNYWTLLLVTASFSTALVLLISPASKVRSEIMKDEEKAQFIFISQVGGMIGGSSASSTSLYISRSGLIQSSKEETDGELHSFTAGNTDSNIFFNAIGKDKDICSRITESSFHEEHNLVSEYYPEETYVSCSFYTEDSKLCDYVGVVNKTDTIKNIIDHASILFSQAKASPAHPGLYVRATKLANMEFIHFDLELESSDVPSFPIVMKLIESRTALILVTEEDEFKLTDTIVLKAGIPVHVRAGNEAYLLFPYLLRNS